MKVTVIGVMRMRGVGKESRQPYDFAQALILSPIENRNSEKFSVVGLGYEVGKLDLRNESLHLFNDVRFPAQLELEIEHVADRRGMKPVVVGFKAIKPVQAAA